LEVTSEERYCCLSEDRFLSIYQSVTSHSEVDCKPTEVIQIKGSFSQILFNNTTFTNALNASPGYLKTRLFRNDLFLFHLSNRRHTKLRHWT